MDKKQKTAEKKRKKTGFLSLFLLAIFFISLGGCIYLIYGEINKELSIKDMEQDIQAFVKPSSDTDAIPDSIKETSDPDTNEEQEDDYAFDWDGLMAQSSYVIGWIQIPGIDRINYPIVQHPDDNQYFLDHDWKGDPFSPGAIFANKLNASDFTDMNTVIYGHRMKAGSMFGSLKLYKDQAFMDEHPCLYIYTPDGQKRTYDIICYSAVVDGTDAYLQHFESPDERMSYYDLLISKAITKRDVELDRFDTTVMLSTCNTTGPLDRVVVLGKLTAIDLNGHPENAAITE